MNPKTRKFLRIAAYLMFGGYLILLSYFLFFSEMMGRTYTGRTYHYNLIPFKEIGRFIRYRKSLGMMAVTLNLAGNVLVFVPYGMFLPLLVHRLRSFWQVVLFSFDFSLLVELLQLFLKVGSFDVDDLVLNTIGGAVGYFCYYLLQKCRERHFGRKRDGT